MHKDFEIKGNVVDIQNRSVFPAAIQIKSGKIHSIEALEEQLDSLSLIHI